MDKGHSHPKQKGAQRKVQQPPTPIEPENKAIDGQARCPDCCHKHKNWPQQIEAACAILLVLITAFYTYYAKEQRREMIKANEINGDALHSVQRAFVNFSREVHQRVKYRNGYFGISVLLGKTVGQLPLLARSMLVASNDCPLD